MIEILNIKILDENLQKLLKVYGATPERDVEAARRTQLKFMQELDGFFPEPIAPNPVVGQGGGANRLWKSIFPGRLLSPFIRRFSLIYLLVPVVVVLMFLAVPA